MAGIYVNRGGSTWDNVSRTELKVNTGGSTWVHARRVYVNRGGTNWGSPIWIYDETPPSGGGVGSVTWNGTGATVFMNAVSDESGVSSYILQYSANNSSWINIFYAASTGGNVSHTIPTSHRNQTVYYRTYQADSVGNSSYSASVAFTPKPYGTFTVTPTDYDTWETGSGGGGASWKGYDSGQSRAYLWSGYAGSTTSWGNQYGFWFYGNNAFTNVTKGYTPDSASVFYSRSSSSGTTGTVYFALHGHGTRPGTPGLTAYDAWTGAGITVGNSAEASLSSAARSNIATNNAVGIFMYPGVLNNSSYYRVIDSPATNGNSGRVTLTFN